jgi:hypothetical protein
MAALDPEIDFFTISPNKEVIFTKPYGEIIIPAEYMDHNIAEIIGQEVDTFGLFNFYVYDSYDVENIKPRVFFFKFPSRIRMAPSSIGDRRGEKGEKEYVLKFEEGDTLITSTAIQENSDVARQMIDIMFNAYLPEAIPYHEIHQFWTQVNRFNGVKPAASEAVLELVVSELARDPNDLSRPFRLLMRDDRNVSSGARKLINIKNIPKYNSTFASVTSGNAKQGITSSIARRRQGKPDKSSPIETAIE